MGKLVGSTRWSGTKKTLEGTLGAIISILVVATFIARTFANIPMFDLSLVVATVLTSLLESFTDQIDNLFLPLYYYAVMLLSSTSASLG